MVGGVVVDGGWGGRERRARAARASQPGSPRLGLPEESKVATLPAAGTRSRRRGELGRAAWIAAPGRGAQRCASRAPPTPIAPRLARPNVSRPWHEARRRASTSHDPPAPSPAHLAPPSPPLSWTRTTLPARRGRCRRPRPSRSTRCRTRGWKRPRARRARPRRARRARGAPLGGGEGGVAPGRARGRARRGRARRCVCDAARGAKLNHGGARPSARQAVQAPPDTRRHARRAECSVYRPRADGASSFEAGGLPLPN